MNIFNYLMNKKEHEIFKNDDILSYLLKKGQVLTASGTEINIKNAKGFEELTLSKLSTQDGTPTPDNPVEVNTVKGYRNLFDVATWVQKGNNSNYYSYTNNTLSINTLDTRSLQDFTETEKIYLPNGTYYLSNIGNAGIRIYNTNENSPVLTNQFTVTLGYIYLKLVSSSVITCNPMITEGTTQLHYVPYGTNWIYIKNIGKNLFDINGDVNTRYDGQTSTNNTVSGNDLTTITNGGSTHLYGQKIYVGTGNTVSLSVKLKSITYTTEPSENSTVAYMSLYNDNTTTGQLSSGLKYNEVGIRKTITFIAQTDYIYAAFGRASLSKSATFTDIQVEIGSATSYEPYQKTIILIPLNDNEICGIGDYKDEVIIDKLGNAKLVKKIGKVVLDGSESWVYQSTYNLINTNQFAYTHAIEPKNANDGLSNYFKLTTGWSKLTTVDEDMFQIYTDGAIYIRMNNTLASDLTTFKAWLSTHNTDVYYPLATPTEIDLGTVDMELYEGTNNITNSEDMDMVLKYYK